MKSRSSKYARSQGFSLMELAIILGIIATLSSFAMVTFGNLDEERDARMVQAVQANLQSIVSQGAARLDLRPSEFQDAQFEAVLLAAQASINQKVGAAPGSIRLERSSRNYYILTIPSKGRKAHFEVDSEGKVNLTKVDEFNAYIVGSDDTIKKKGS